MIDGTGAALERLFWEHEIGEAWSFDDVATLPSRDDPIAALEASAMPMLRWRADGFAECTPRPPVDSACAPAPIHWACEPHAAG